jgi:hypothetical protein
LDSGLDSGLDGGGGHNHHRNDSGSQPGSHQRATKQGHHGLPTGQNMNFLQFW